MKLVYLHSRRYCNVSRHYHRVRLQNDSEEWHSLNAMPSYDKDYSLDVSPACVLCAQVLGCHTDRRRGTRR